MSAMCDTLWEGAVEGWKTTEARGSFIGQEGLPRGSDAETVPEPTGEMDPRQRAYVEGPEGA